MTEAIADIKISYRQYDQTKDESELEYIKSMVTKDLSEPYSIYVYRYFIYQWPELCFIASVGDQNKTIGVIVGKLESHHDKRLRGYIAMLTIDQGYRGRGIAKRLINLFIDKSKEKKADEIMLETEVDNKAAIGIYQQMHFIRIKRLQRYYLHGQDAYRMILPLTERSVHRSTFLPTLTSDITTGDGD